MSYRLQANWIHTSNVEEWLKSMVIGTSLNVCCGKSMVGDVRIDKDANTSRTEDGNVFALKFAPQSFDTVICDPPFRFYNRFDWILKLSDIARKRLLISPDRTVIKLDGWKPSLFAFIDQMYLRLYYCFDREQAML